MSATRRRRLTAAHRAILSACGELVLAGEWPFEGVEFKGREFEPEILEEALTILAEAGAPRTAQEPRKPGGPG